MGSMQVLEAASVRPMVEMSSEELKMFLAELEGAHETALARLPQPVRDFLAFSRQDFMDLADLALKIDVTRRILEARGVPTA
jgi:hypothetical protein